MGKEEIENFPLRIFIFSLRKKNLPLRDFSPHLTCKAILLKQIAMGSIVEKQQG